MIAWPRASSLRVEKIAIRVKGNKEWVVVQGVIGRVLGTTEYSDQMVRTENREISQEGDFACGVEWGDQLKDLGLFEALVATHLIENKLLSGS
jgi:hypothetical protein